MQNNYLCLMKAVLIKPKSQREYKIVNGLLKKHGIASSSMSMEELEDIGLSKLMGEADRTKKVSRESVILKLKKNGS